MAKLKNITNAEINDLMERSFDLAQTANDLQRRAERGYRDEIDDPIRMAANLLTASRSLADLAAVILIQPQLLEQERRLEGEMRSRAAPKGDT